MGSGFSTLVTPKVVMFALLGSALASRRMPTATPGT